MTGALRSYVDGVWRDGVRTVVRTDPAHPSTVVAEVSLADAVLASAAVLAARKAFASWRATPAPARGEILRRAADLMEHQFENIGRDLTREGVRESLERVKQLPATSGYDGTTMGFGVYDHAALKGRYLVLREWRDGDTVQVER